MSEVLELYNHWLRWFLPSSENEICNLHVASSEFLVAKAKNIPRASLSVHFFEERTKFQNSRRVHRQALFLRRDSRNGAAFEKGVPITIFASFFSSEASENIFSE